MRLTIKSNGKIINARIVPYTNENAEIHSVEVDYIPPDLWSDLEFWLEDENGKLCDYAKMNLSKRKKMKFSK